MPQPIEQKQKSAAERQAKYDALTPKQRIERLDAAFGVGFGAKRERARILKKQDAPKVSKADVTEAFKTLDTDKIISVKKAKK